MQEPKKQFRNNRKEQIRQEVAKTSRADGTGARAKDENPVLRQSISLKKRRSRKRLFRKLKILLAAVVLIAIFLFSPLFKIREVKVEGIENAGRQKLETAAGQQSGRHFLFYRKNEILAAVKADPFVKSAEVSADIGGTLLVTIEENTADYALTDGGSAHIVSREGQVLGTRVVIPAGATLLIDDTALLPPGSFMYGEGRKKDFLTAYKDLMAQNTSLIDFDRIDLKDPRNIILESGDWQVEIGEGLDLERKLNQAINILKQVDGQEPGIIDLKYNAPPVIRSKGGA